MQEKPYLAKSSLLDPIQHTVLEEQEISGASLNIFSTMHWKLDMIT